MIEFKTLYQTYIEFDDMRAEHDKAVQDHLNLGWEIDSITVVFGPDDDNFHVRYVTLTREVQKS